MCWSSVTVALQPFVVWCVATLTFTTALFTSGVAKSHLPNICVILVDDMGYGDPRCFNPASKIATPQIDSLAKQGMRFLDAHAPGPLCHMSRYGLLTGCYPFRTDVTRWPTEPLIEEGQVTIASLAKSAGYRTAMVGKWHLGFREKGYEQTLPGGPIDCGFDSFFGLRASTDIPPYFYIRGNRATKLPIDHIEANHSEQWSPIQGQFWRAGEIAPDLKLDEVLPRLTDEAIQVIAQHAETAQDQPLMLYLAYPAPHTPWLPAAKFRGSSKAAMYGDFVSMVDYEIGRVLEAMHQAGMSDETLVVFTSDNGPVWYEKDKQSFGHDAAGGLRGMKSDAWEGGHRMPFIVRWPGVVDAGTSTKQTICFTDLLATFAEVMGSPLPSEAGSDSFSFLPVLTGKKPEGESIRGPVVIQAGSRPSMMSIRMGSWKLITELGSGGFTQPTHQKPEPNGPKGQLYNLDADPGEENNLYHKREEIVAQCQKSLQQIVESGHSRSGATTRVDTSTLSGKVMCGYQGWFNTPDDGMGLGWKHWARNGREPFAAGNVTVDFWPDISEFSPDELFATGFTHSDRRPAEVFSSVHPKTIRRHFEWMVDYGIDGVFLQRFANGLKNEKLLKNKNQVLQGVRDSAKATGRAYVVMYDLSGLPTGGVQRVLDDWRTLANEERVTADETYLKHHNKPLVAIWGVGFLDGNKPRDYSLEECRDLVLQLKRDGCSVMLGVPSGWRELKRDSVSTPDLHELLTLADVISPWTPGRYRDLKGVALHAENYWTPDVEWCSDRDVDYLPVVFPGFSWHNLKGAKLGEIPRLKGQFLWSQFVAAKRSGADMIYVAMFDEVDEGTAIFKCSNDPPVGPEVSFLDYDGLPSDHYLWLTGQGARMLRGEIRVTKQLPRRTP